MHLRIFKPCSNEANMLVQHPASSNTNKHHQTTSSVIQHDPTPSMIIHYLPPPSNAIQHHPAQCSIKTNMLHPTLLEDVRRICCPRLNKPCSFKIVYRFSSVGLLFLSSDPKCTNEIIRILAQTVSILHGYRSVFTA